MSESLWSVHADALLRRTASSDPTPGGGSVAAVTGAFGAALVLMALAVTDEPELAEAHGRGQELLERIRSGADRDVTEFEAVMAAYRMPKSTDAERAARSVAVQDASALATLGPLELAEQLLAVAALADEVQARVTPMIESDVKAGRDIALGAARAAMHTADINLAVVRDAEHLQARRAAIAAVLEARQ